MQQQQRREQPQVEQRRAPEVPAAPAVGAAAGPVRLLSGADVQDVQLAGRTVAEARRVARAVLGTEQDARAVLDGQDVAEDHVLEVGQRLEFVKRAGHKGAVSPVIEVTGARATWSRNGKGLGELPLRDLVGRVEARGQAPERWRLYPHHVRLMVEREVRRRTVIPVVGVVVEMPPGPREVAWIADNSPAPYGSEATYQARRLSFPWVVLLVVYANGELSGMQQAFYRPAPLSSLDDRLYFTNLLNVAEGYGQESWVCLANLRKRLGKLAWAERVRTVTDHFWQAAFSLSSEFNEGNSHWGTRGTTDPRFETVDTWETATRDDPYFALEVTWRPAPRPLGATLGRMLDRVAPWRPIERAEQLVTILQQEGEHDEG
jgi:hypothetical protein